MESCASVREQPTLELLLDAQIASGQKAAVCGEWAGQQKQCRKLMQRVHAGMGAAKAAEVPAGVGAVDAVAENGTESFGGMEPFLLKSSTVSLSPNTA